MYRSLLLAFIAAAACTGCASYGVPLPDVAPSINSTLYLGPALIKTGDVVDVQFPRKPTWNAVGIVRLDGRVSFPIIGEVRVAGMTIAELGEYLGGRYSEVDPERPQVHVNLGNAAVEGGGDNNGITVSGEVRAPGLLELSGRRLTLLEALGRAGGHLKDSALLGNTLLLRRSPRTGAYRAWRIDARLEYWGMSDPVFLQPHDLVFVPNTPIDDVNIWVDKYIRQNNPVPGVLPFALGVVAGDS